MVGLEVRLFLFKLEIDILLDDVIKIEIKIVSFMYPVFSTAETVSFSFF